MNENEKTEALLKILFAFSFLIILWTMPFLETKEHKEWSKQQQKFHKEYEKVCVEKKTITQRGYHKVWFGVNTEFGVSCNCHVRNKSNHHWGNYTNTECVKYEWIKK
jgi:hypothetical protein